MQAMRGLIVLFLVLGWASPALSALNHGDPIRLAQHAADTSDSGGAGHALDSGPIGLEADGAETGAGPCAGGGGIIEYFICQAEATISGGLRVVLLPLTPNRSTTALEARLRAGGDTGPGGPTGEGA